MEDRKLNTQFVATPPGAPTQTLSPAVRAAVEHIGNNHESRIRLIDLAVIAAQTRFQLIRAFRREIGTTPHAYLVRVRVLAGTLRLAAGEPIASIATAVGFADQAHFTRHFISPRNSCDSCYSAALTCLLFALFSYHFVLRRVQTSPL
jgi:transcriptional regulator GlxA family with amidase domain